MKGIRTSPKLIGAMKVKRAVLSALVSLALASQAFAVLRPPFPAKPDAPLDGELITVGNDLVPESAKMLAPTGHVARAKNLSAGAWRR